MFSTLQAGRDETEKVDDAQAVKDAKVRKTCQSVKVSVALEPQTVFKLNVCDFRRSTRPEKVAGARTR